ncbi:hypothetical protein [Vibrio penaeicida]|uniref:hypothetical protein n=1 Tax=Vibrio penaeicida TaxID=104609 RepID=UPI000CE9F3AF|nr:hypothetical protein [Vibrio penaeicida]
MGRGLFVRVRNDSSQEIITKVPSYHEVDNIQRLIGLRVEPGSTSKSQRVEGHAKFLIPDAGDFTLLLTNFEGKELGEIKMHVVSGGKWAVRDASSSVSYNLDSGNDEHLLVTQLE